MLPSTILSDITVYNAVETANGALYLRTAVKGVYKRVAYETDERRNGVLSGSSVTIIVPFGADFGGKGYAAPDDFKKLPQDVRVHYFTFCVGDRIVCGVVSANISSARDLERLCGLDSVFTIKQCAVNGYGGLGMRHFKITAK